METRSLKSLSLTLGAGLCLGTGFGPGWLPVHGSGKVKSPPPRMVTFPGSRTYGELDTAVCTADQPFSGAFRFANAMGTVAAPPDKFLLLKADYDLIVHPERLKQLKPNAIDGITFNFLEATDDTVKELPQLSSLRLVCLRGTEVTDKCIPYLVKLPRLEALDLSQSNLQGIGLGALSALKHLNALNLSDSVLAAAAYTELEKLPITDLRLIRTRLTDDGVRQAVKIAHLQKLSLATNAKLTKSTLQYLRNKPGLIFVDLMECPFKAEDLLLLKGSSIKTIWFDKPKYSLTAINAVQEQMPGISIQLYEPESRNMDKLDMLKPLH